MPKPTYRSVLTTKALRVVQKAVNKLLRSKHAFSFAIGCAGIGAGLLTSAAADSGPLLKPFGIGLVLLSVLILVVAALARRAGYLRHTSEAQWFIDQPQGQQEGYLLFDEEMKIHAVNERARQWVGDRCVVGMSLDQVGDGQAGWSAMDRQLRSVSAGVGRLSG